ncbi:MAG: hypothetical protein ACRD3N_03445 [Terracidiphilus sp.]
MRLTGIGARIVLALVSVGLIQVAAPAGPQTGQLSPNSFAVSHSVVVIGPNSPLFDSVLQKDFPGVSELTFFGAMQPLLAIVHNNTKRVIKAYVVKWTITNADGSTSAAALSVISEDPLEEGGVAGTRTVLGPAGTGLGTQLVCPFRDYWSRRDFAGAPPGADQSTFVVDAQYEPLVAEASTARSIQTTLDGAIFGDGVFVGPDTSKLFERFEAEQKAEVDEANWMLTQLNNGITNQQLTDALSQQIYNGRNATGTDDASLYTAAQGRAAEGLLADLLQQGQQYMRAVATTLAKATPALLRRQTTRAAAARDQKQPEHGGL